MSVAFELSLMIFHRRPVHIFRRAFGSACKHNDIIRVEGDDKISVVALKCHQPFRAVDIKDQWNLPRASVDPPLRTSVLAYAKR